MASPELLDHTVRFWQARSGAPVSREDARQMVENAAGFFALLKEWDASEREREHGRDADDEEARP